jgi:Protein of unknown function (DUF3429)
MTRLGYAGLTPFYLFAVLAWSPVAAYQALAQRGLVLYSLAILAFLAGSLWGSANVRDGADKVRRLVISNLLTVLGVLAVMFAGPLLALLLLAILHLGLLWYETSNRSSRWYLSLRRQLTWLSMPAYLGLAGAQLI